MLSPLQRTILITIARLDAAVTFALAGGAALIVHGIITRATRDLDLFTEESARVDALHHALVAELQDAGMDVRRITATPTFVRLEVCDPATEETIEIDLGVDVRMTSPITTDVGPVLSLEELAADKLLALYGRAELRDFLDIAALLNHFSRTTLMRLAREKDKGFHGRRFAEALAALHRFSDTDFSAAGTSRKDLAAVFDDWRSSLED
jgi:hypothetical protein